MIDEFAAHPFVDFFSADDIAGCATYLERMNESGYLVKRKHIRTKADLEVQVRFEKLCDILPNSKSTSPWYNGKIANISNGGAQVCWKNKIMGHRSRVGVKFLRSA